MAEQIRETRGILASGTEKLMLKKNNTVNDAFKNYFNKLSFVLIFSFLLFIWTISSRYTLQGTKAMLFIST